MAPDGMHTLADFITNIMNLITSSEKALKIKKCEKKFDRFQEMWQQNDETREESNASTSTQKKRKRNEPTTATKRKKGACKQSDSADVEPVVLPWTLAKNKIDIADKRATSVVYPEGNDYLPGPHFSKMYTLRTMHGKLQFVQNNVASWCLRGLLPKRQETTLFRVFAIIDQLTQKSYHHDAIEELINATSTALSLLERDFPLTLQNLTTHLIHHIPRGYRDLGPLYGRWLFPLERANCWITRQIHKKGQEEANIMSTYANILSQIHDWCSWLKLSMQHSSEKLDANHTIAAPEIETTLAEPAPVSKTQWKQIFLPRHVLTEMKGYLFRAEVPSQPLLDPIAYMPASGTLTVQRGNLSDQQLVTYQVHSEKKNKRSTCCYVRVDIDGNVRFGRIKHMYRHTYMSTTYSWTVLDLYPLPECENQIFWYCEMEFVQERTVQIEHLSMPLVTAVDERKIWFLNANVSTYQVDNGHINI